MAYYAAPFGKAYHSRRECNGLNSYATAMPYTACPEVGRKMIVKRGLKPCAICQPSPMLREVPNA